MRLLRASNIFVLLSACAAEVPVTDGGSAAPSEVGACGVSIFGVCREGRFVRCDGAETLVDDCGDAGGRCAFVGTYAVCASPVGASCRTVIDHGSHQHLSFSFCDGAGSACVATPEAARCRTAVGSCVEGDIGRCRGPLYLANCRGDQAIVVDCAAHGGRCDERARGCAAIPQGGVCDPTLRRCGAGLECRLPFRRALFGRCEPPPP